MGKRFLIPAIVGLLLIAFCVVFLVLRGGAGPRLTAGQPADQTPAESSPPESIARANDQQIYREEISSYKRRAYADPSQTAAYIKELILYGLPDIEDLPTRQRIIRLVLRDVFNATGSLEETMSLMAAVVKETGFTGDPKELPIEALPLIMALYDVAMSPQNWKVQDGQRTMVNDHEARVLAEAILLALERHGRTEEARQWLTEAIDQVNEWLDNPPEAARQHETILQLIQGYKEVLDPLWEHFSKEWEDAERTQPITQTIAEQVAELESGPPLTPQQQVDKFLQIADLYKSNGQYREALEYYDKALQADPGSERRKQEARDAKKTALMASLPPQEKVRLAVSKSTLKRLGAAFTKYAADHSGLLPSSLQELTQGKYATEADLIDPVTAQPYEYVPGSTFVPGSREIIVQSVPKDGLAVALFADGTVHTILAQ